MGAILWYLVYRQYHFIANVARGGQSPAVGEVILPSDQNIHEPKLLDNLVCLSILGGLYCPTYTRVPDANDRVYTHPLVSVASGMADDSIEQLSPGCALSAIFVGASGLPSARWYSATTRIKNAAAEFLASVSTGRSNGNVLSPRKMSACDRCLQSRTRRCTGYINIGALTRVI